MADEADTSCYNDVSTYTALEGIKSLEIRDTMAEQAKEKGIDWYKVWPELESYEVYSSSD